MSYTFPKPPEVLPCASSAPPQLPAQFHAVALLTPFDDSQLVVADILYDWSVQALRITTYGLESGYADLLYTPSGYYILDSDNGGPPSHYFGPITTDEQVPEPTWLAKAKVTCNGIQDVLNVSTEWWCGLTENKNGLAPISPVQKCQFKSANWFWLRTDNKYPWRMMFINTTNDYKLPFIGCFSFVHFPAFEAVASTNLPDIVQGCAASSQKIDPKTAAKLAIREPQDSYNLLNLSSQFAGTAADRPHLLDKIQELIPGLVPPDNNPLPSWPSTLFMTALTTPTFEPHDFPNQPYPTQIYYDWPKKRQLTRFFMPDDSIEDAILTGSKSYLVIRQSDGSHKCSPPLPVGLPYPDWTTRDGGRCKGVITNNPQLSPNKTTGIYVLNSQPPRVFWIWYTTNNEAIMFAEVPQSCNVELILTDYFEYMADPPAFDPTLFDIPQDCLEPSPPPSKGG
ncbi:MAG: hypothetical protein ACK2U0_12225 [Candidatus Promineifilaceae bacterium]|jgi:hypothetical protein